jgi:hypothetical protein
MKPALQFLKLVDKNAEDMFKKIRDKYGKGKIVKPKKASIKVTENDL